MEIVNLLAIWTLNVLAIADVGATADRWIASRGPNKDGLDRVGAVLLRGGAAPRRTVQFASITARKSTRSSNRPAPVGKVPGWSAPSRGTRPAGNATPLERFLAGRSATRSPPRAVSQSIPVLMRSTSFDVDVEVANSQGYASGTTSTLALCKPRPQVNWFGFVRWFADDHRRYLSEVTVMQAARNQRRDVPAPILDVYGPNPQPTRDPGIELDVDGNHAVEWVAGEIDDANADHVVELGSAAIAEPWVDELVVDLSRVTFMGSAGLGALIRLRDHCTAASKRFALRGVPAKVSKVMTITGLDRVFGLPKGDAGRC